MKEAQLNDRESFLKIAVENWKGLVKTNPALAEEIMKNPSDYDYKRVKSSTGAVYCVPMLLSEEEIQRREKEMEKYDNMPTIDEYVEELRRRGDGRSDGELVEAYVNEYFD